VAAPQELAISADLIEQFGPALHHLDALRPVLDAVVGGGDLVLLDVGELTIDDAQVDAQLLLDVGHGQGSVAVAAHAAIEAHALEGMGGIDGAVADGDGVIARLTDHTQGALGGFIGTALTNQWAQPGSPGR
jgi:hypothetical protein